MAEEKNNKHTTFEALTKNLIEEIEFLDDNIERLISPAHEVHRDILFQCRFRTQATADALRRVLQYSSDVVKKREV